jgi:hypothetical protein
VRARALAKQAGCDLAIIDKRRPKANESEVMNVIGEVEGRNCVIMDDMIDTAGTLVKAVRRVEGARRQRCSRIARTRLFGQRSSDPNRSSRGRHHHTIPSPTAACRQGARQPVAFCSPNHSPHLDASR